MEIYRLENIQIHSYVYVQTNFPDSLSYVFIIKFKVKQKNYSIERFFIIHTQYMTINQILTGV